MVLLGAVTLWKPCTLTQHKTPISFLVNHLLIWSLLTFLSNPKGDLENKKQGGEKESFLWTCLVAIFPSQSLKTNCQNIRPSHLTVEQTSAYCFVFWLSPSVLYSPFPPHMGCCWIHFTFKSMVVLSEWKLSSKYINFLFTRVYVYFLRHESFKTRV